MRMSLVAFVLAAGLGLAACSDINSGQRAVADAVFGSNGSVPGADHYKSMPGNIAFVEKGTPADTVRSQMYGGNGHDGGSK